MAIRPRPFNVRCPICNWTQYCQPRSDCFMPWEVPTNCKRCGNADLQIEGGINLRLKAFLKTHFGM